MSTAYFPYSEKEAEKLGLKDRFRSNEQAEFPVRLRKLRKNKGETLEHAAREIGVTRSTLGLYEKGENVPDVKVIVRIASHYGATVNYLLGEDEHPTYSATYIAKETGLSSEAIEVLRDNVQHNSEHKGTEGSFGTTLSLFITSEQFPEIVRTHLASYKYSLSQKILKHFGKGDAFDEVDKIMIDLYGPKTEGVGARTKFELFLSAAKHRAMDLYGEFFEKLADFPVIFPDPEDEDCNPEER